MARADKKPLGLETLLDLNGVVIEQDKGCWVTMMSVKLWLAKKSRMDYVTA